MNPDLQEVFDNIRATIESDDILREKIIKLSRKTIRKCSESIRACHRRELEVSAQLLSEAKILVKEINVSLPNTGLFENNATIAYQEYVEALELHHFVFSLEKPGNSSLISLQEIKNELSIPYVSYLHGLSDLVGELRRFALDSIRLNKLDQGEKSLALMDELFSHFVTLDYPNALVPGIRRKTDLIRGLLEKTRADLTLTHNRLLLSDKLDELVKKY